MDMLAGLPQRGGFAGGAQALSHDSSETWGAPTCHSGELAEALGQHVVDAARLPASPGRGGRRSRAKAHILAALVWWHVIPLRSIFLRYMNTIHVRNL